MATLGVRSRSLKRSLASRFRSTMRYERTPAKRCEHRSTSWGSLVRAQYRPPHESPARRGFSLFCKSAVRPASGGNRMATRQSVLRGCKPGRGPQGDPRTTLPAPQQGTRLRLRHRAWQMAVSEGSSEGSSAGLALAGVWSFGATTPSTRTFANSPSRQSVPGDCPGRSSWLVRECLVRALGRHGG
jgi:hypothetical protein